MMRTIDPFQLAQEIYRNFGVEPLQGRLDGLLHQPANERACTMTSTANLDPETGRRTGALVAGIAMIAMAVLAAVSYFGIIDRMIVPEDANATAMNIANSAALFRLGATGMVVVAILDVVVAWGFYLLLRSVNPTLALLGAWFRVAYAAIFAVAITSLFSAVRTAPTDSAQAAFFLGSFEYAWQLGLIVFALHLAVIGSLVWRSDFIPWIFGALLIVAGAGYLIDGLGTLLTATYGLAISTFTFVGEVAFIFWLLLRGRRLPEGEPASA